MTWNGGVLALPQQMCITLSGADLLAEAQTAQDALVHEAGVHWPIVAAGSAQTGLALLLDDSLHRPQSYHLTIGEGRIVIRGADPAGVFYGVNTLRQLLRQYNNALPVGVIHDWPDFPARGVMLDISRDRVPTLRTLYALIDRLASWKINQVQLYMEHTFAYQQHTAVWAQASPYTGQEILELDAYCRQRHVVLLPNQNSLGHMERWLKHPRYQHLAECPDGFYQAEWARAMPPTSLNAADPASAAFMAALYDELLPHFTCDTLNVGCDEPWELGQCRSRSTAAAIGAGRLYLEYLLKLHEVLRARGKRMMFWDDIIVNHPELVPELPRDLIALVWGYEADHPFDARGALFHGSGIPFYVCPGTSSWNSIAGRTANARGNLLNAAVNGLKHGAVGYLITDWGDNGHWQPPPVSYPGFAYGAALGWALAANTDLDLPAALDWFAFEDAAHVMGQLACDLGDLYTLPGLARDNGSRLFDVLQAGPDQRARLLPALAEAHAAGSLRAALAQLDALMGPLETARMARPDAALIADEYRQCADLLRHACRRALYLLGDDAADPPALLAELDTLAERQRRLWLARSRPGGLGDSLARLEAARALYSDSR
jgi:hypothetical protein